MEETIHLWLVTPKVAHGDTYAASLLNTQGSSLEPFPVIDLPEDLDEQERFEFLSARISGRKIA